MLSLALPAVEGRAVSSEPDDLLVPAPHAGYLHAQNWRRDVRWNATAGGRRPHDLRHTPASLWIAAGVDIRIIASCLDHSSTKLTLDTYGHLLGPDAERAAIERVNRACPKLVPRWGRGSIWEAVSEARNRLTCTDTTCPRQDSNLRHPL